jgi:CBS domain-containing protein
MNINSCMSPDVRLATPGESIREAARTMKEIDAGILPVEENDRIIGMITDRDIAVRAVAEGKGPDTRVRDVMSQEVLYCYEDEGLEEVARQMRELQIRRMPVLSRAKRLVGIISLADLAQSDEQGAGQAGAALAGVAQPGGKHTQS